MHISPSDPRLSFQEKSSKRGLKVALKISQRLWKNPAFQEKSSKRGLKDPQLHSYFLPPKNFQEKSSKRGLKADVQAEIARSIIELFFQEKSSKRGLKDPDLDLYHVHSFHSFQEKSSKRGLKGADVVGRGEGFAYFAFKRNPLKEDWKLSSCLVCSSIGSASFKRNPLKEDWKLNIGFVLNSSSRFSSFKRNPLKEDWKLIRKAISLALDMYRNFQEKSSKRGLKGYICGRVPTWPLRPLSREIL